MPSRQAAFETQKEVRRNKIIEYILGERKALYFLNTFVLSPGDRNIPDKDLCSHIAEHSLLETEYIGMQKGLLDT